MPKGRTLNPQGEASRTPANQSQGAKTPERGDRQNTSRSFRTRPWPRPAQAKMINRGERITKDPAQLLKAGVIEPRSQKVWPQVRQRKPRGGERNQGNHEATEASGSLSFKTKRESFARMMGVKKGTKTPATAKSQANSQGSSRKVKA